MNFNQLLNDNIHGSQYIVTQFLNIALRENWKQSEIIQNIEKLMKNFPSMSIIVSIKYKLESTDNIKKEITSTLNQIKHSQNRITKNILSRLNDEKPVLTFSNSQTVLSALKNFKGKIFSMESIPGREGKELSKELESDLVTDEKGKELIKNKKIQSLIIGADQYSKDYIVNKKGTGELTSLCLHHGVDVYVLTSTLKHVKTIDDKIESELLEKSRIRENMVFVNEI